ncbi:copper resistance protein CopC [Arthrobacter sp. A2-55]|uniref:copper resistance CopC family protein n=1 Tax=Arthrobacter sp. A2-55 TaxID=2897337 RepID=UPI0021CDA305|nr:copper resistance CopC family protein [Arthrobacter sp. A2-55]MCU6480564.1 copper resistance protein CopC [Arthrobacter sp. A2-55]
MKPLSRPQVFETNMTPPAVPGGTKVLWRALAGAAVVLLALLGGSGAAQAHDSLEATSPADGSSVATAPHVVTLTMSNTPAAIGAEVKVLDASGTNWSEGAVSVLDNVATQAVKPGAPAGKYTVQWRLVSSDSHPVEGQFTFTAKAAAAGSAAVAGPAESIQAPSAAAAQAAPDGGGVPWSVFGLMGVLVVVVVAMVVVARKRLKASD